MATSSSEFPASYSAGQFASESPSCDNGHSDYFNMGDRTKTEQVSLSLYFDLLVFMSCLIVVEAGVGSVFHSILCSCEWPEWLWVWCMTGLSCAIIIITIPGLHCHGPARYWSPFRTGWADASWLIYAGVCPGMNVFVESDKFYGQCQCYCLEPSGD